jgi:hypothetical protein
MLKFMRAAFVLLIGVYGCTQAAASGARGATHGVVEWRPLNSPKPPVHVAPPTPRFILEAAWNEQMKEARCSERGLDVRPPQGVATADGDFLGFGAVEHAYIVVMSECGLGSHADNFGQHSRLVIASNTGAILANAAVDGVQDIEAVVPVYVGERRHDGLVLGGGFFNQGTSLSSISVVAVQWGGKLVELKGFFQVGMDTCASGGSGSSPVETSWSEVWYRSAPGRALETREVWHRAPCKPQ